MTGPTTLTAADIAHELKQNFRITRTMAYRDDDETGPTEVWYCREEGCVGHMTDGFAPTVWTLVHERVALMTPAQMGELIGSSEKSLYDVHSRSWLGKYDSGPELLKRIAATAVVAEIRAFWPPRR